MTLANKYLRYSPEITLEIFKLAWDKLESIYTVSYNDSISTKFKEFENGEVVRLNPNGRLGIYSQNLNDTETTVQEILGYDPFVKEDFVLPEKWCIKRNNSRINEWLNKNNSSGSTYEALRNDYAHIPGIKRYHLFEHIQNGYTEITFDQFKKYVLKEPIEQSKSIEKWSVGSYVVFLKDLMHINAGYIDVIKETLQNDCVYLEKYLTMAIGRERSGEVKWFATKSEAEEFAKTLVGPVKEEVKQPLKQAVHCKTQEEYKFLKEKISIFHENVYSKTNNTVKLDKPNSTWSLTDCKDANYQILSFQEWCQQGGYKMESNIDLTGRNLKALIDDPQSTTYKKGDIVEIFKKESSNQYRIGKVGGVWWTYTTNNGTASQWELLPEDYKMEKEAKFEVGQLVWISSKPMNGNGMDLSGKDDGVYRLMDLDSPEFATGHLHENSHFKFKCGKNYFKTNIKNIRHATSEEINNHLISIGQIPVGEPLNNGIEPNEDGMFKYTTYTGTTYVGKCSTVNGPLKMTLSIDDEELPMVSIIKTNSIKQLLNND